jgi:glycosyltransferase involved in cell wall biosynthesis
MHVLLIHQAFATPADSGGTRHYELALEAIRRGHEFTVVTSRFGYISGAAPGQTRPKRESAGGIDVRRAASPPTAHGGFIGQLVAYLGFALTSVGTALSVQHIDVVMGTSPPIFQAVSAWFVAFVRRKPFLLEIRDLWPEFIVDMGKLRNPIAIALARRLERFLYARADHLLVNSPAYVDYLLGKGIARERITLIPNGVNADAFAGVSASDRERARAALGVSDAIVVMYAGAMGPANDLPTLLAAADLMRAERRDIKIVLVGGGKSRQELEAMASQRGLTNVVFAGSRTKDEMRSTLAAADVCVATLQDIAMFRMTYPNKVFDYLAAGRPIVLAIDGVIRDVVERADAGVFAPPGNPRALADAITRLADDVPGREAMGRRGQEYVRAHFGRAEHGRAFATLVESMPELASRR